ncbi:MAG: alpha-isopropylmalate synthase regulatory domain-containing protein, partial [Clostridia bacterium]
RIYRTSTLVASVIGLKIPPNKAIIGANAFAHEAGIHQHGVMLNRETYEIMSPESIGIAENKMLIGKHSGRHAFESLLIEMGYNFTDDKIAEYFESFKVLADRKKFVTRRDVEALLPNVTRSHSTHTYKLKNYEITSYLNNAYSEITLACDSSVITEKESGDGPVDASFKAINNIIGKDFKLIDFSIHSVTEGKDALGEANVKLGFGDEIISGRGVSTDVLESAILAYIDAANKTIGIK